MVSCSTHPRGTSILLVFQVVFKEKNDTNRNGLEKMDKLLTAGVQKYLVVITYTEVKPKLTVPEEYRPKGFQVDCEFLVYHLQIGDSALF